MSAFIIVAQTPRDPEKLKEYGAKVGATLQPLGGEILARGPATALKGQTAFAAYALLRFPDKAAAAAWYESPAYQALYALRDEAMDSQFVVIG